jgi:two-component system alkaline phosphatase synthesis response regulator PhoP/two-component system response regulator VicR
VVDDEPAMLRLMEFIMQRKGYGMLTATNGEEALQVIRQQRPDLVLLDIMMPRLDGYEVAEAIRKDPATAEIPIVMLSAKAQNEDIERGLAVGVDTYVTKPFDPEKLAETVAALLSGEPVVSPDIMHRGN